MVDVDREISVLKASQPKLFSLLSRLEGITGFVSVLGHDPKVKIFARSHHVIRVFRFTAWLCDNFPLYDVSSALFIAMFHDINRLPFAHNLEKRIGFNQALYLDHYLHIHDISISESTLLAINAMLKRDQDGPASSRLVYAADSIAGFIEDPLFAISTLGLSLFSIPSLVLEIIGLDHRSEKVRNKISHLSYLFNYKPDNFVEFFNKMVEELGIIFLRRHNRNGKLFVDQPDFYQMRQIMKNTFLVKQVYPINNEQVSQGSRLASEVAIPYIESLRLEGIDPIAKLLEMTDQEVLDAACKKGLLENPASYYPLFP